MAQIVKDLIDGIVVGRNDHPFLLTEELDLQPPLINLIFKRNKNKPSHLTDVKGTHRKLPVPRLNTRQIQQ